MLNAQPNHTGEKTHPRDGNIGASTNIDPIKITIVEHFKLYLFKAAEINYFGSTSFCETEYCKNVLKSIGVKSLNNFNMGVKFTNAFTASEKLEIFNFIAELRRSYEDEPSLANLLAMLTIFQVSASGNDFAFLNMIVPALQQAINHNISFDGAAYINKNSIGPKINLCAKRLAYILQHGASPTDEQLDNFDNNVNPDAKATYKQFALKYHPDRNKSNDTTEIFKLGAAVYKEWCALQEKVNSARISYYLNIFQKKLRFVYDEVIRHTGISQKDYEALLNPAISNMAEQQKVLKERIELCAQVFSNLIENPEYKEAIIAALRENHVIASSKKNPSKLPTLKYYKDNTYVVVENFIINKTGTFNYMYLDRNVKIFLDKITESLSRKVKLSDDLNPVEIYEKQLEKEKAEKQAYAEFMKTRIITNQNRVVEFNKRCKGLYEDVKTTFANIASLKCSSEEVGKLVEESRKALQHAVFKENLKLTLVFSRIGFATAALFAMKKPVVALAGVPAVAIAAAIQLYCSESYREQKHLGVVYKSSIKSMICDSGMDSKIASIYSLYSYFIALGPFIQIISDIKTYGPAIATRLALKYEPIKIALVPVLIDAATITLYSLYTKVCTSQALNLKYFFAEGADKEYVLPKPKIQTATSDMTYRDYFTYVKKYIVETYNTAYEL